MPTACVLGDYAMSALHDHGNGCCPHMVVIGPSVTASANVYINDRPALTVGDMGNHAVAPCCGPQVWRVLHGSSSIHIHGRPLVRLGDPTIHCGLTYGVMVTASTTVTCNGEGMRIMSPEDPNFVDGGLYAQRVRATATQFHNKVMRDVKRSLPDSGPHAVFDGLSWVPGVGNAASAVNAAIYAFEGDVENVVIEVGGVIAGKVGKVVVKHGGKYAVELVEGAAKQTGKASTEAAGAALREFASRPGVSDYASEKAAEVAGKELTEAALGKEDKPHSSEEPACDWEWHIY